MPTAAHPAPAEALLDDHELRAWRSLKCVYSGLSKALDAELEAAHGLPLTTFEVLRYVGATDAKRMRMCDLADSILLSRSGLTRLIDRLERDGLIQRESCSSDARGAYAVLTAEGEAKLHAAKATHRAAVRRLFLEHFSADELDSLASLLGRALPGVVGRDGCC
jgi:DNA-binding MarR family transcriptional regulator